MEPYPKIHTIFKRDPNNKKRLLFGEYSLPVFEYLKDNTWEFTEKFDGTNLRVIWQNGRLTVKGRKEKSGVHPKITRWMEEYTIEREVYFRDVFPETDVCLYGEGIGPGINKAGKHYGRYYFVVFDIKIGPYWLKRENMEDVAGKLNAIVSPIVGYGTLKDAIATTVSGFQPSLTSDKYMPEGLVLRPLVRLRQRNCSRVITKIKHKDFLYQ